MKIRCKKCFEMVETRTESRHFSEIKKTGYCITCEDKLQEEKDKQKEELLYTDWK